jgi:hypothetical protein
MEPWVDVGLLVLTKRGSRETRAWLDARPPGRFEFTFTPKHGSWLNLIKGFDSKFARSVLRRIRVTSKYELKERITAGIDDLNRHPVIHTGSHKLADAARYDSNQGNADLEPPSGSSGSSSRRGFDEKGEPQTRLETGRPRPDRTPGEALNTTSVSETPTMPTSSYTSAAEQDITVAEYLQQFMRGGGSAAAAVAHLYRECREGYIELRPSIDAIRIEPSGEIVVEIAGQSVSPQDCICHVRSRAERLDYFAQRDRQQRFNGAGLTPVADKTNTVPPEQPPPDTAAEPVAASQPEAERPIAKAAKRRRRKPKPPDWLIAVAPVVFPKGVKYPSLGSARDAVKSELGVLKRRVPHDRTIERALLAHRRNRFRIESAS